MLMDFVFGISNHCFTCFCYSILEYELLNLQIPTINVVGSLVKSGIRVLVYRYEKDTDSKCISFSE